jgi:hypothetical protein
MKKPRPREREQRKGVICANCQRLVMLLKLNNAGDVVAVFSDSVMPGQEFYSKPHGHIRHDTVCLKLDLRPKGR